MTDRRNWRWGPAHLALVGSVLLGSILACAPIPPPDILGRLAEVRAAPISEAAADDAPGAFAAAEELRRKAHAAFASGDVAGSQLLGERAFAAYQRTVAVARATRAARLKVTAQAEAEAAEEQLRELEAEHQRVEADIRALEQRLRLLKELLAPQPSGEARGLRKTARREAVRSLALQAALLCSAAELLERANSAPAPPAPAPPAPANAAPGSRSASDAVRDARARRTKLDELIAQAGDDEPPIDHALAARSACLAALTQVRRRIDDDDGNGGPVAAATSSEDLLDALSAGGHGSPRRDERGVVVTLRDVFSGAEPREHARTTLLALAAIAKHHPRFPVMIVLHQHTDPSDEQRPLWQRRGEALRAVMLQAGVEQVGVPHIAGTRGPVVAPNGKYKQRNERVDIVFVAPEAS